MIRMHARALVVVLCVLLVGLHGERPVPDGDVAVASEPKAVVLLPGDMGIVRAYVWNVSERMMLPLQQLWPGVWSGESSASGSPASIMVVRRSADREESWTAEVRTWPLDARVDLSSEAVHGQGSWKRTAWEGEPVWIRWRPGPEEPGPIHGVNLVAHWLSRRHHVYAMKRLPDASWIVRVPKRIELRPGEMEAKIVIQETGPARSFLGSLDELCAELSYESR